MEPLLHSGSGGGNAGGGTVAYDAAAHCRILSGIECGASGFRGGDALSMGAGSHLRLRTRSAGGQPAVMEGSKRRKRKNDRIDANKLARLGRVDPQSLHPMRHRSKEVRQDLVVLRARDALVAARTELINATRGLVKSMGSRLPKCSSPSFAQKVEEAVPVEIREALLPLVRMAAALSDCIQGMTRRLRSWAARSTGIRHYCGR